MESNEQIVSRIKAGDDVGKNMLKLWEQNRGYIRKVAWKFKGFADVEDLEQEGYIGLCYAVEAYNPDGGAAFITYADYWIRQIMGRYIENCGQVVRVPVHAIQKLKKCNKIVEKFRQQFGRFPSEWELRQATGFDRKTLKMLQEAERAVSVISLDAPVKGLENEDAAIGDTVSGSADVEGEALENIQSQELRETLWPMVDSLSGQMGPVLRMSYQEELHSPAIGEKLGISMRDVQKLKKKGIQKLREPKRRAVLRQFLRPEDAEMHGYAVRGGGAAAFNWTRTSSTEKEALQDMD